MSLKRCNICNECVGLGIARDHIDTAGASVFNRFGRLRKRMWVSLEFVVVVGEVKGCMFVILSFVEDDFVLFILT